MITELEDSESFDRLFSPFIKSCGGGGKHAAQRAGHLTPTKPVHEAWIKLAHSPAAIKERKRRHGREAME
jgi:hypothetical protein